MLEDFGGCWRCFFLCVPVPSSCARACSVSRFGRELYIYIYIYIFIYIYICHIVVIVLKAKLVQMPRADFGSIPILMPMAHAMAMLSRYQPPMA